MGKRIMFAALGAVLAAVGWVMMTYTSYSPAMAFVGAGLMVLLAVIYHEEGTPQRFDVVYEAKSEAQTWTSL